MSATSEHIAEQIRRVKERIQEAKNTGCDASQLEALEAQYADLNKKFAAATEALTEGRSVLKG